MQPSPTRSYIAADYDYRRGRHTGRNYIGFVFASSRHDGIFARMMYDFNTRHISFGIMYLSGL